MLFVAHQISSMFIHEREDTVTQLSLMSSPPDTAGALSLYLFTGEPDECERQSCWSSTKAVLPWAPVLKGGIVAGKITGLIRAPKKKNSFVSTEGKM